MMAERQLSPCISLTTSEEQDQLEELTDENSALKERMEKLEEEFAILEYRQQGLKERPFWKGEHASSWFLVTESEFRIAGVSDDNTKFNYVVSQLDDYTIDKVKDIVCDPPVSGKYDKIKEELILRLGEPEFERFRKLFEERLAKKTPSEFYRHLQVLAGTKVTADKILLHLWLRQLPQHCQHILVSQIEQTITKLSEIADNIMEATEASVDHFFNGTVIENLQQCVDELSKQLTGLEESLKWRQIRSRSLSTNRSYVARGSRALESKICWYHQKWGYNAYRCVQPCDWKQETNKE